MCEEHPQSEKSEHGANQQLPLGIEKVKAVIVGPPGCGKTEFLRCLADECPGIVIMEDAETPLKDYCTVLFQRPNSEQTDTLGLCIWGPSCGRHIGPSTPPDDVRRPITYSGANVALLCFALNDTKSVEDISEEWVPELLHFLPDPPIVLIGMKLDLRPTEGSISTEEGRQLCKKVYGSAYVECSSRTRVGIQEAVQIAIKWAMDHRTKQIRVKKKKPRGCIVL